MSDIAIKIENLSKSYKIGHKSQTRHNTMRDLIAEQVRLLGDKLRHPLKSSLHAGSDTVEEFWALKDVSFEIKRGDSIGIVGRNGAGKSTLLKVLSRITEPTTGRIEIDGRVASLLEVGTGFHSELTGRENIFLNGSILGMKRDEIRKKFDEIVAFSEVEQFLDTPVKRYSSGMYVRLAFAVAAHLEPEILIVDEVLAVGDTQFQKKCLGKMEEVGRDGRTVLFVSHNMAAVQNLCNCALLLESGEVKKMGEVEDIVENYLSNSTVDPEIGEDLLRFPRPQHVSGDIKFSRCTILDSDRNKTVQLKYKEPFSIKLEAIPYRHCRELNVVVGIQTIMGQRIFTVTSAEAGALFNAFSGSLFTKGVRFPSLNLTPGVYRLFVALRSGNVLHDVLSVVEFEISDQPYHDASAYSGFVGLLAVDAKWD